MANNSPSLSKKSSIVIIGAGTFGISTAYFLAKRGYANIKCLDRHPPPSPDSAGYDLNKIIRTEYDEPLYTELALEALNAWRQPEWRGIFHETGRIVTTLGDPLAEKHLKESYENLKKAGQAGSLELVEGKEQIAKHVPQLRDADGIENWKGLWNSQGGWAHAKKSLEKWGREAQDMGVRFVSGPGGTMVGLKVDGTGKLDGISVASGDIVRADRYILCTGAASPEVLPELSREMWTKCWSLAHVELSDEEVAQWKGIPVVDNFELGFTFEPDPETRWMKICDGSPGYQYRVGTYTDPSGKVEHYSIPRYASTHPEDGIPEEAARAINRFIDTVMPQFSGRPLLGARVCWCTDSPDAHWLIDNHPKHPSLLLATGDSGHAFKMFPIIGDYISDALEGKERGLRREWRYGNRQSKPVATRLGTEVKDLRDVMRLKTT
ncbi:FAD dependent oxidoreductase [Colletotrichum higginsianum]|uniref:FAD dependent oxidoreductase n=2 Tax=Colletotrichum higginsianum TaxID=80884 RepID=H1VA84_COLHI|nr:FAD dependent oxidoreductase [Colletotrichum higginsianum IMI 349063]OBR06591.1 FAD dependent oxidoreductase [Colletotrichum higginsianum IMI 349063]TIC97519.1 L-saccharopine oxidase [Colletotrichum higginsianum]CCF37137.1 FAD dependent oxidoreductase [Colletotrichum higginsianum]